MSSESTDRLCIEIERSVPKNGLHTLLTNLIDYAGLFPPASLPLGPAIDNYAAYQVSEDVSFLGRFVIPISKLIELKPYLSLFSTNQPLVCSALGSKTSEKWECLETLGFDLEKLLSFKEQHGEVVKVDVLELPLPPILPEKGLLSIIGVKTAKMGLETFCEMTIPLHDNWERSLNATLDAISEHNANNHTVLGFKLRTGGVTADAIPTCAQVAAALIGCRDRGIAMKFTAGLHHPFRMYRHEVKTQMHGFVNVFVAGILAHDYDLDVLTTEKILEDENPKNFSFSAEGLAWHDWMVSSCEIERLRKTLLRSFGSCSFDEPREDLRTLKIL